MKKRFVVLGLVVLFVVVCAVNADAAAPMLAFYFFAAMLWLLFKACQAAKKKYSKPKNNTAKPSAQPTNRAGSASRSIIDYDFLEDDAAAYEYSDVGVFVPDTSIFDRPDVVEGATVTLRQEPTNKYDNSAVAVVIGRKRIGYLYRGRLQDMANDWLYRGDSVHGRISSVAPYCYDAKKDGIKIDLYFYE